MMQEWFVIGRLQELKRPLYIVMVGVPGSGKSTFVELAARELNCVIASTDNFDPRLRKAPGGFMPKLYQQIQNIVAIQRNVIIDQTSIDRVARKALMLRAPQHYVRICVDMSAEFEKCVERCAKRDLIRRRVPHEIIKALLEKYQAPLHYEGFDHIYHIAT